MVLCNWPAAKYISYVLKRLFAVQSPGGINVSVWFTLFGVASSFVSTFFAFSYVKYAAFTNCLQCILFAVNDVAFISQQSICWLT